jgi:hypothetical protein
MSCERYVVVCRGEEEERRIRAESLSDDVPFCKIVEMKARSDADSVLEFANWSSFDVERKLVEKVSERSVSNWVARVCKALMA